MFFRCSDCISYAIGHVNNTPTMQFFPRISRNTQSKSYMLSLTECVWDFQKIHCGIFITYPIMPGTIIVLWIQVAYGAATNMSKYDLQHIHRCCNGWNIIKAIIVTNLKSYAWAPTTACVKLLWRYMKYVYIVCFVWWHPFLGLCLWK